ncbi:MAG: hypothetical protein ACK4Z5_04115 [Brevundimonas sp.]
MAHRLTFNHAVETYRRLATSEDPAATDDLEHVEVAILKHRPRSAGEAAAMIEVVLASLEAGGRSDGLDTVALQTLLRWLSGGGGALLKAA